MTENIVQFPEDKPPKFMIGPMTSWPVVIEGRLIPGLTAWEEGDKTFVCVADRMAISVPNVNAYDVCYIVAQALAVGAGYNDAGAETKDRPFARMCAEITTPP